MRIFVSKTETVKSESKIICSIANFTARSNSSNLLRTTRVSSVSTRVKEKFPNASSTS
jgi:hypothetical protein